MSTSKKKKQPDSAVTNSKLPVSKRQNKGKVKKQLNENRAESKTTTTNMEAYHPHIHHPKRSFKDYISEFVLIFVAITGGFFMENIREHVVDRRKEKEYIIRLVQDIKEDTTSLKLIMGQNRKQMDMLDSLVNLLEKPISTIDDQFIILLAANLNDYHLFLPRDITMNQLKNTGGLRLIENSKVSDNIVSYYSYIEFIIHSIGDANTKFVEESFKEEINFINFNQIFKTKKLKISDTDKMKLANRCFIYKIQIRAYNNSLKEINEQGAALLQYLKEEYRIKNDEQLEKLTK